MLYRIAGLSKGDSIKLTGIKTQTYNTWVRKENFVALHRRLDEFSNDSKQEAIQLLRRDNQFAAAMLERKIIARLEIEVATGEYELIKTNFAKEVYSKLMNDLDTVPIHQTNATWIDKLNQYLNPQLVEGNTDIPSEDIIDGSCTTTTGQSEPDSQHSED